MTMKSLYQLSMVLLILGSAISAQAQIVVAPTNALENGGSMGSGRTPDKVHDGSGLYDRETIGTEIDDLHDNVRANQWGADLAGQALRLALPGAVNIDRVYLWNAVEVSSRGVQSCDFLFSTDGGSTYANPTNLNFTQGGTAAQTRSFPMQTGVTHVMMTNFVSWNSTYINLAEVRFGRPLATGRMQWHDWRIPVETSVITHASVQLSAILAGTNADVTLYWEEGTVADPAAHAGWDGSVGPSAESTGTITRTASGLTEGTEYSYAFYATNSTHATEAWAGAGTIKTLEGEIVAEYLFDGDSPASSDEHSNAAASDVSLGAGISTSLRNNRIECAAAEVGTLSLGGDAYFGFTLTIPANVTLNLTRFTYTYEEASSYTPQHALWTDATGEVTTPATRYSPPSLNQDNLSSLRTIVHDLAEAGATFQELAGTNIEFRLYMGDGASGTGEQRFDGIRLYAVDPTPADSTVLIIR